MPNFKMEFYNMRSGVQFELNWLNETEFSQAQSFLRELLGGPLGRASDRPPDKPEFYLIETEEQRDAVFKFAGELRRGAKPV